MNYAALLGCLALVALRAQPAQNFVPDLPKAIVYEANLRAMGPPAGFRSLAKRLPQIRALGVNVLWLMPVQPVGVLRSAGGRGSPYAIRNYRAINPEFGDERDFRTLVNSAHRLKMAVILDWVADHTSWDNPWITEHPAWYLHDAQGHIIIPPGTNYNDVAALNYRVPEMQAQMITDMKSWVERYGVDGFRCDAADRLPLDFWRTAIGTLRSSTSKRLLMLAEGERPSDYAAGFDLTYGWNFSYHLREVFQGKSAMELAQADEQQRKGLSPGDRRLNFITNHDYSAWEGSLTEFYKTAQGAEEAFAIAALYGGNPMIYTGQEVGFDKRIPIFDESSIDWSRDPITAISIAQTLTFRNSHPAFLTGSLVDHSSHDVVLFRRREGADEGLVIANVRGQDETVSIDPAWQGRWDDEMDGGAVNIGKSVSLWPFGCRILTRKTVVSRQSP